MSSEGHSPHNFSGLKSLSRRSAVRAHGVAELAQGRGGDRVNRAIGRHWMVRAADDDRSRGAVAPVRGWAAAMRSHPRISLLRPRAAGSSCIRRRFVCSRYREHPALTATPVRCSADSFSARPVPLYGRPSAAVCGVFPRPAVRATASDLFHALLTRQHDVKQCASRDSFRVCLSVHVPACRRFRAGTTVAETDDRSSPSRTIFTETRRQVRRSCMASSAEAKGP